MALKLSYTPNIGTMRFILHIDLLYEVSYVIDALGFLSKRIVLST